MREKSGATRRVILAAALQLFLKKGYKEVSYQDLIGRTGLSKGAIYHHFKSKEELLVSVFEFLMQSMQQPEVVQPELKVKDMASFRKLFLETKQKQFESFKKMQAGGTLKFNKLLFFLEAINENEKLKKIITELLAKETLFLENCFRGLKKHNQIPRGSDPALLAKALFLMLQGAEMILFFVQNNEQMENFMKTYDETIQRFFTILQKND